VTMLACFYNSLTTLDVSHNATLDSLYCSDNSLTKLDVTQNTALTVLNCGNNSLSTLDLSHNAALTYLDCYGNLLTTLDVSHNAALEELCCSQNSLNTLDVTKNTALQELDCDKNFLTELDLTKNTVLEFLYCEMNSLTKLNLPNSTALQVLWCSENSLTELDVTKNTALQGLRCSENSLTSLDVTNNTELWKLNCCGNQITGGQMEILVSSLVNRDGKTEGWFYVHDPDKPTNVITKAQVLTAEGKNWRVMDIDGNDYDGVEPLKMTLTTTKNVGETIGLDLRAAAEDQADVWIDLNNNGKKDSGEDNVTFGDWANYTLEAQTVTIYGKVTCLNCSKNSLTALDVSHNAALQELYCYQNSLTKLDVTKNTALTSLDCNTNSLTALDVPNNTALEKLYCYGNQIKEAEMGTLVSSLVDRSSFTTAGEFRVYSSAVPNNVINKTQVANAKAKKWNVLDNEGNDYEGTEGAYTATSMILTTTKNIGEMIDLFIGAEEADQADVWIDLNNNGAKEAGESITNFTGYVEYTIGSKTITIYGKVTKLFCSTNALTNIDVTNNTTLQKLDCPDNLLKSIDLSKNTELFYLHCNNNLITALDFSNNTKLENMWCYSNKIKEDAMGVMVNSMPNRQGKTEGKYMIAMEGIEDNEFTDYHKSILTSKNWIPGL